MEIGGFQRSIGMKEKCPMEIGGSAEQKDYRVDVSNTFTNLFYDLHFFVIVIDILHIDLLFLYSSRPCGIVSYQSNAY